MRVTLKYALAAVCLVVTPIAAQTPARTVLVELFTSEGCSSCPPADALLARLPGMRVETGELVVGLSEHVTYWNSLGWQDPFSQELWTARQQSYASRFGIDSVYTPQVVVNGEQQLVGSDARGLLRAVHSAQVGPLHLKIEEAKVADGKVQVNYTISGAPSHAAEVWAVVADDAATSQVLRGENGGRRLSHVAVARSLTRLAKAAEGNAEAQVTLPETIKGQEQTGRHLVLFVQERAYGKVLAVESSKL